VIPATIPLGSRQVGEGNPCFVLAEVASAHGGSADAALRMLEAAFKMGADGIKFQLFRAEALVVRRHPAWKDFEQIELTEKEWRKVLRAARASGLALLVEAFDPPSLAIAAEEGADAFKVHSTDMENPEFIRGVAAAGKPVLFATGGVPEDAVREAGLAAGTLHLEVTENVLLNTSDVVQANFERLRQIGVSMYLDDFGTGYSSLSYLQRYPVDALKLDSSFVARMGTPDEGLGLSSIELYY